MFNLGCQSRREKFQINFIKLKYIKIGPLNNSFNQIKKQKIQLANITYYLYPSSVLCLNEFKTAVLGREGKVNQETVIKIGLPIPGLQSFGVLRKATLALEQPCLCWLYGRISAAVRHASGFTVVFLFLTGK